MLRFVVISEVLTSLGYSIRLGRWRMYRKSYKKALSLDFQTREIFIRFEWTFNLTRHLNLSKILNLLRFAYDYMWIQVVNCCISKDTQLLISRLFYQLIKKLRSGTSFPDMLTWLHSIAICCWIFVLNLREMFTISKICFTE